MRCIDAHLHIFEHLNGYAFLGEFRPLGNGKCRWAGGPADLICTPDMGDRGVSAESMISFMDRNEIEMGVLLQGSAYGFHNEFVAESVHKFPDRFIGTATIDPFFREFDTVLDRLMEELAFTRFKLEMSATGGLCGFHDENMLWNHKNLHKLMQRLNDIGGTISFDIGMPGTVSHRVEDVRNFAEKYPDLNIIVCHLCSMPADAEEILRSDLEVLTMPNIYFDVAALCSNTQEHAPFTWARRYHKIAKEMVGAKKLLWGTDSATVMKDYTYAELQSLVTEAGIYTDDELNDLFLNNAHIAYRF